MEYCFWFGKYGFHQWAPLSLTSSTHAAIHFLHGLSEQHGLGKLCLPSGRETTALLLQIHKGVHVPRWEKYQKPMAILLDWMKRKGRHFLSILLWIPRQFKKHHWSDHWHWGGNAHPQKTCRAQPSLTWAVSGFWCNPFCKLPPHTHVNPCFLL